MFRLVRDKNEKALIEIKKKKLKLDNLKKEQEKLKEEIVQMGKLVLKDGRLQKVEDVTNTNKGVTQEEVTDVVEEIQQTVQRNMQQPVQRPVQSQPRSVPPPLPAFEDAVDNEAVYQQPVQQVAPQYRRQQVPQPPQSFEVSIYLINGQVVVLQIPRDQFETFIEDLNGAIDNQSCFPLSNRVINGRNVVEYIFQ
jgi:hypothetical protein